MTYAVPGPIRTNIVSSTSLGGIDSPFTRTRAVLDMMKGWEIMKAVTEGTESVSYTHLTLPTKA